MPYCTNCGSPVGDTDRFCARCGGAQGAQAPPPGPPPPSPSPPPPTAPAASIRPNHAALLCYIPQLGWIASVIFMTLDPYRSNRYIRFHALQGLFLFVIYLVAQIAFAPIPVHLFPFQIFSFRKIVQLLVVVAQIFGIIRTARNEDYRLPILSELAEKSMV